MESVSRLVERESSQYPGKFGEAMSLVMRTLNNTQHVKDREGIIDVLKNKGEPIGRRVAVLHKKKSEFEAMEDGDAKQQLGAKIEKNSESILKSAKQMFEDIIEILIRKGDPAGLGQNIGKYIDNLGNSLIESPESLEKTLIQGLKLLIK